MKRFLLLVLAVLASSISPAAAAYTVVSGRVTAEHDGHPLPGICVDVRLATGGISGAWVQTDEDGRYDAIVLAGAYHVRFEDCAEPRLYLSEWYDDAARAEDATVVVAKPMLGTRDVDAALELGSRIEGSVHDERGRGLGEICVTAYDAAGRSQGWAGTAVDGRYALTGLVAGTYKVGFDASCYGRRRYESEYFNDRHTLESADIIVLPPSTTLPGVDAALVRLPGLGSGYEGVTGSISDPDGAPLRVCVEGHLRSPDTGAYYLYERVLASAEGVYKIDGPPGTYKIFAFDCGGSYWVQQRWFDGALSFDDATPITVQAEAFSTADITLPIRPPLPHGDVSVEIREIENVLVRTDVGPAPVQPGNRRRVNVELVNDSVAEVLVYGSANACPVTMGRCDWLGSFDLLLAPHERRTITFDWSTGAMVGDARIEAGAWAMEGMIDDDPTNDSDRATHYAVVGGTGYGVGRP